MKHLFGLVLLIAFSGIFYCQDNTNPWVVVENSAGNLLQIDISTLKAKEKADIYVWGLQTFKSPVDIEGIGNNIYKVKTYYLINPELGKYSILKVAYYGIENRMLKEFSYLEELSSQSARYNYPIMPGSDVEAIYKKTVKYFRK